MNIAKYDIIKVFAGIFQSLGVDAYLVGGAVRDLLLNVEPLDFDFVGEVDEQKHFEVSKDIFNLLNCKYNYNDHYHTAKFVCDGYDVDFVMARRECYENIASKPKIYSSNLLEDLKRRDYTINSMAISLGEKKCFEVIDPYNGKLDLRNKIIRVLHDKSFKDDPTRVLRGIKYAGRLGFDFEDKTKELIDVCTKRGYLNYLSTGRLKQEIIAILEETSSLKSFSFVRDYKILDRLVDDKVVYNLDIKQQDFNILDSNRKLAALLYKNNLEVLNQIKTVLNLGNNIIEFIIRIKEIKMVLDSSNEDFYTYLLKRQNTIDENLISTVFYRDIRLQNYFMFKNKIKIDKIYLANVDKANREKYILDKKLEVLGMYIDKAKLDSDGVLTPPES
jgi:tRNA nucleotidyltransferase/poly(A) polymerase